MELGRIQIACGKESQKIEWSDRWSLRGERVEEAAKNKAAVSLRESPGRKRPRTAGKTGMREGIII